MEPLREIMNILWMECVDSTNSEIRRRIATLDNLSLIATQEQTAGRGQGTHTWYSSPRTNLLFSMLFRFSENDRSELKTRDMLLITEMVTLGIRDYLLDNGISARIKWPNDIYWKDKKICGILIENELEGAYLLRCIAGIGVNINQEHFVSPAPNPVSLKQILGRETDKQEVLESILKRLFSYYIPLISQKPNIKETIHSDYLNAQYRHKGMYPYRDENGEFKASLEAIEPDGHLLLRDENGMLRKYAFKEVQYII